MLFRSKEEEFKKQYMNSVVKNYFDNSYKELVNFFVEQKKLSPTELKEIIDMIEKGRECVELAQQLHAVEKAISNAKKTLIHDHIDHCLEDSVADDKAARQSIVEFKEITKYL